MTQPGKLVVLEGLDEAGKTTLAGSLVEALSNSGRSATGFSFPGKGSGTIGEFIYSIYSGRNLKCSPEALQTLHIAAHVDIIQTQIIPALQKVDYVILDRFYWSTLAYGKAEAICEEFLQSIVAAERIIWQGIVPYRLFLVHRTFGRPEGLNAVLDEYEHLKAIFGQAYPVLTIENDSTIEDALRRMMELI